MLEETCPIRKPHWTIDEDETPNDMFWEPDPFVIHRLKVTPKGVARHWDLELVSVFLLNLMSFPIASMRLVILSSSVYKYKTL